MPRVKFVRGQPFGPTDVVKPANKNYTTAEIWKIRPDGSGLMRLTFNADEERAPAGSPDGSRIAYMCRQGPAPQPPLPAGANVEICVMNSDGSGQTRLTTNTVFEATPTWSPDGSKILFGRQQPGGRNFGR